MFYNHNFKTVILALVLCSGVCAVTKAEEHNLPDTKAASHSTAYTKEQMTELINKTAATLEHTSKRLRKDLQELKSNSSQELIAQTITELVTHDITPEQRSTFVGMKKTIVDALKEYKVTGAAFTHGFNAAFFLNTQKPEFTVSYKNAAGDVKTRNYQAEMNFVGLNVEVGYRFNYIFFTNTDLNFFETDKKIELGTGVQIWPVNIGLTSFGFYIAYKAFSMGRELALEANNEVIRLGRALNDDEFRVIQQRAEGRFNAFLAPLNQNKNLLKAVEWTVNPLCFTYVPFVNAPGGMIMVSYVIDALSLVTTKTPFSYGALGMINGGSLTPVTDQTK